MSVQQQILDLREALDKYNYQYYVENNPTISDFEFDRLMRELQELEAQHPEFYDPNSPTMRVGSDTSNAFQSVEHSFPMLSLSNTYSIEELGEWIERIEREVESPEFVCELKFDGTAISLTYEHGRLLRAVTRGDGTRGDDVTANVRTIRTIPLVLKNGDYPDFFEIRGEIFMPYASFDRLNLEREAAGEPLLANPRNAAAGTLKQLQSQVVAKRGLDCTLYQPASEDMRFTSHIESLDAARSWGFKVSEHTSVCKTRKEIEEYIKYWDTARKSLPYATDGVVIKVNRFSDRKILGTTSKAPKWAVAYKFKAEQALTRLLKVSYQVGRTGAITPVANLEPVLLAGTTVKRATLHNADQIAALDIREGDMVYVEKGGEIIPKITEVELSERPADSTPLEYITHCPECGAELVRYEGEAKHYCPNQSGCRPQILGRIEHFVGRKAMNIQSLGDKIITHLFNMGYIKNIDDLYNLDIHTIANTKTITNLTQKEAEKLYTNIHSGKRTNHQVVKKLLSEGVNIYDVSIEHLMNVSFEKNIGEKTAEKIIDNIKESANIPFHRALFALGIRFVGETTAKYLATHFKSLDAIMQASKEELMEAEEVGDKIADSIIDYFKDDTNIGIIKNLLSMGLKFQEETKENISNSLEGLTIVVSGVFDSIERDALKALIAEHGGKVTSSVSASTSYLVTGHNAGPSKLEKANKFGVKIISEKQILEMIEGYDLTNIHQTNNLTKNNHISVIDTPQEIVYYNNNLDNLDFIAFDCEWANDNKDICEFGLAIVKNAKIIDSKCWLINPLTDDYKSLKHNKLTKEMLQDAPSFRDVWPEIHSIINNQIIICHNKGADIDCLEKMLSKYNITGINFTYICSMEFAQKHSNCHKKGLKDLCSYFNIEQKEHHRAEDDAKNCASVFIECYKTQKNYNNFQDLVKTLGKAYSKTSNKSDTPKQIREFTDTNDSYAHNLYDEIDLYNISTKHNYCNGLNICTIGSFKHLKRTLCDVIEYLGGTVEERVTKSRTNILVYGSYTFDVEQNGDYKKALKYNIECISEGEFIERIKNHKTAPIQGSLF